MLFLVAAAASATTAINSDILYSVAVALQPGEQLISADGKWKVVFQTDGIYNPDSGRNIGVTNSSPGRAAMQGDGNFCLYTQAGVGTIAPTRME